MTGNIHIYDWNPGLLHPERTLGEVVGSLPAYPPEAIPSIIRFFENPDSKWSLPGSIYLCRHDAIHALLGRGLASEDEGFVLGFTMGASDGKENRMTKLLRLGVILVSPGATEKAVGRRLRDWQIGLFRWVTSHLYAHPDRFSESDLIAFDLGLSLGECNRVRNLEDLPLEEWGDRNLGDLRGELGIDVYKLEAVYRAEMALTETWMSRRLDVDSNGADHSRLARAQGPDCDWMP
jgi:hypothetical protein